jgi:hypothetical protein
MLLVCGSLKMFGVDRQDLPNLVGEEVRHLPLSIRDLGAVEILTYPAPGAGWTYEAVCDTVSLPAVSAEVERHGALEAYLGAVCMASTEY